MQLEALLAPRTLATSLALGRAAIGAAFLAAPGAAARGWIGDDVDTRGARVFVRATGGRDLALAAGALAALAGGRDAGRWVRMSMLADGADVLATVLARPRGTTAGVTGLCVLASGTVALSAYLAPRLD